MPPGRKPPRLPRPHTTLETPRGTLRFFLGDCLDVLAALPRRSVSVMVASPPYNLGICYRSYDDTVPRAGYLEWTGRWVAAAREVLETEGSLFLNVGAKPSDPWIKSVAIDKGSGGPSLDRRAISVPYQEASNIDRWQNGGRNLRCRGNTWFIPYETIQNRDKDRPHPATFPPRVPEYCFKLHGLSRASLTMDPFLGLGSTAVAAARLGLDFIGVELDEHYLREAVARTRRAIEAAASDPVRPARA